MYMLATRLDSAVFTNWATNSLIVRLLISALTVWCLCSTSQLEDNCRARKTRNLLSCLRTMPSHKHDSGWQQMCVAKLPLCIARHFCSLDWISSITWQPHAAKE